MFNFRLSRIVHCVVMSACIIFVLPIAVAQTPPPGVKLPPGAKMLPPNFKSPPATISEPGKPTVTKHGKLTITETSISSPMPCMANFAKVSPDCQHAAMIGLDSGKFFLMCDKYQSPRYDMILPDSVLFSPDGKRIAFATKQGDKMIIVLTDGTPMPPMDNIGVWRGFSPDSKHFAFIGIKDKKAYVYYDGKPSAGYDAIIQPWFSPDSAHFAFAAKKGDSDVIVLDGKEQKTYAGLVNYFYSPKADRLAVLTSKDKKFKIILDGKESIEYDRIDPRISFSPDGKRFVYTAEVGTKKIIVVPGEFEKEYEMVGGALFSPDSQRLAYVITKKGKYVEVVDGVEGKECDEQQVHVFSPDSKHLAYDVHTNNVAHYVIDGVEGKTDFDGQWAAVIWSPAGNHYSYIASKGSDHFVVIDDVKSKSYGGEQSYSKPVWSADGKHVVHAMSPDRKYILLLVDGKYETPPLPGIAMEAAMAFDANDKVHCISYKDGKFYHIEIALNP